MKNANKTIIGEKKLRGRPRKNMDAIYEIKKAAPAISRMIKAPIDEARHEVNTTVMRVSNLEKVLKDRKADLAPKKKLGRPSKQNYYNPPYNYHGKSVDEIIAEKIAEIMTKKAPAAPFEEVNGIIKAARFLIILLIILLVILIIKS